MRYGYETFCPAHAPDMETSHAALPIDMIPVQKSFLSSIKGCQLCDGDAYDADFGAILTCSICYARQHSKCVVPNLEQDATFAACSRSGKFYCKTCMRCVQCEQPVDKDVYNITNPSFRQHSLEPDGQDVECDTVICHVCKYFTIHVACLPKNVKPETWRCGLCRICRHCNLTNISSEQWNEHFQACPDCTNEIRNGGVVCPVCSKVYREGENLPMVQCDYCDKWIHADICGGLTRSKFEAMGKSESKYRCPICREEKRKRDLTARKRSKGIDDGQITDIAQSNGTLSNVLDTILKQVPHAEGGIAFHSVRKASSQRNSLRQVFRDLCLGTEICRHCCSSGTEESMRFCADCGECYHYFCNEARSDPNFSDKGKKKLSTKKLDKGSLSTIPGGLGINAKVWLCFECDNFANLSSKHQGNGEGHSNCVLPASNGVQVKEDSNFTVHVKDRSLITVNGHGKSNPQNCFPNGSGNFSSDDTLASHLKATTGQELPKAILWADLRLCELCNRKEDHSSPEGRLIPWASNMVADMSHSWVHIGCVMWSVEVSLHGSSGHCDTFLGPRRYLLSSARRTACMVCGRFGATLTCSYSGCDVSYHFHCAREVAVTGVVKAKTPLLEKAILTASPGDVGWVNMEDLGSLSILCPSHGRADDRVAGGVASISDTQRLFNVQRLVRIIDRQGFTVDGEVPRKKRLSPDRLLSMRIGALTVIQFGQLVPEVDSFVMKGCLVPLGYCAARRFWSIACPGQRCVYFLEVCGFKQSGPLFVIRCSDAPNLKLESKDPDDIWRRLMKMVKDTRINAGMEDVSYQRRTTGLEAFGLLNCIPVVTHIEALPMASMFKYRYAHKRVVTHKSNDIIFYNSLAERYRSVDVTENSTGCCRSEGYLPVAWIEKHHAQKRKLIPRYRNARTGAAFQLDVARELFSRNKQGRPKAAIQIGKAINQNPISIRNAKTKSAALLPAVNEHRGIAASSKTRSIILRSDIDGWGVFATRDIPGGEMIIEYVGEIIRPAISDLREVQYSEKGIGCYMFEIIPGIIVDATMRGNAARYINHSCAPNCYSKTIALDNKRHVVVIFAKRRIQRGEELVYDYQFPFDESDRVKCECGAAQCKGWMN